MRIARLALATLALSPHVGVTNAPAAEPNVKCDRPFIIECHIGGGGGYIGFTESETRSLSETFPEGCKRCAISARESDE